MSTKPNHRRQQDRIQDNGSTYEGDPNDGGKMVRLGRRWWKAYATRTERRNGKIGHNYHAMKIGRPTPRPSLTEGLEELGPENSRCYLCEQLPHECFCFISTP